MIIRLSTFSSSTPGILPILSWMNSVRNHHPPIVKHVFVYISEKSMWTCLKPHLAMNGDWEGRSASTAGRGIQNAVARRRGDHLHDLVDTALPMGGLKKMPIPMALRTMMAHDSKLSWAHLSCSLL